ncbi:DnaD domain-containing protein [Clostridium ganghwense]|uniref:DnaD domain-containing protein n=1 Tax=Clostridium ganghwense TaxID=312089 RepID=UPI003AF1CEC7
MAKYRQLHTDFWNDGFVLDLTPEEKYFYLYLMTNPNTAQCGIYELPKRIMETHTGYNRETVDKLLQRFKEYGKIDYCDETKEIMIINWIKYNQPNNTNAVKCVNKELKNIKNIRFISTFYKQCVHQQLNVENVFEGIEDILQGAYEGIPSPYQGAYKGLGRGCFEKDDDNMYVRSESEESQGVTGFNKPLIRGLQGAYKGLTSNKVISNKEVVINNEEEVVSNEGKEGAAAEHDFKHVIIIFKNNIHTPTSIEYEKLIEWSRVLSCDVVVMAIEEAVNYNVRNMSYIERILFAWQAKGINTLEKVRSYQREWDKKKKAIQNKGSGFDYMNQREYDYKELEIKLLGWDKEMEDKKG